MFKQEIKILLWIYNKSKSSLPLVGLTAILSAILSGIGVYSAFISKSLIDAATSGKVDLVIKWLAIMGGFFILQTTISSVNSLLSTYSSTRLFQSIQKQLYEKVTYSEWLEQSQYHSMNLLSRLSSDVSTVSGLMTGTLISLTSLSVTLCTAFIALLYLDKVIAILTIVVVPIFVLVSRLYGRKVKHIYQEVQNQDIKYRSFIQESIQNLMIVKTFCHELQNLKKLDTLHDERLVLSLKSTKFSLLSSLIFQITSYATYFSVFAISTLKLAAGSMTFGTMTAMLQLYNRVSGPISGLASLLPAAIRAFAAAERLIEIESLHSEEFGLSPIETQYPIIEFDHVYFHYPEQPPVIQSLSFTFQAGEIIGLIGPSGGGKTTIIRLLLSLLHPNEGLIKISDSPLNPNHRQLMSYVPQGNTLFTGTIRENIAFGVEEATDDDIIQAATQACAWDFIEKLDLQLNTLIGEKGLGLSEGQAQRIAIARAFLRTKPILILDEATSALDPETELKILTSIQGLAHRPTCIIITHRPAALEICHRTIQVK